MSDTTGNATLVTGAAGFIGFHVAKRLCERGHFVIGLDNLNDYYEVTLKKSRLDQILRSERFEFVKLDLADRQATGELFGNRPIRRVVHLAAQAGVRYSIENPHAYVDSNLVGFVNVLEGCRHARVEHLVYASSSSVYGGNTRTPFSVHHNVDHPVSLYAATKKADELLAHAYAHLYRIPCTGLRFFTVYGPWGRPDMAAFIFTKAILDSQRIELFNHGRMRRDFTYIDDVVEGVLRVLERPATPDPAWAGQKPDPATSSAPHRLYNIGNNRSIELLQFVEMLERILGRKAERCLLALQPGDVLETCADVEDLERDLGFAPSTPIEVGLQRFVDWYRWYYKA
jgi:UDP-glucuronate 4-epimerase